MRNPCDYFFELPAGGRPAPLRLAEIVCPDIGWYNANRASNRMVHAVDGIEGVVIHATAGTSTAGALGWWKHPKGSRASAHWIVPDEDEAGHGEFVVAAVYESLAAWHVRNDRTHPRLGNRTRINHWTLGIEIVNSQSPDDGYSDWQMRATAQIVRYCWAKYPRLRYVFSHAMVDPGRRSDPGSRFDWDGFTSLIVSAAHDPAQHPPTAAFAAKIGTAPLVAPGPGRSCCM